MISAISWTLVKSGFTSVTTVTGLTRAGLLIKVGFPFPYKDEGCGKVIILNVRRMEKKRLRVEKKCFYISAPCRKRNRLRKSLKSSLYRICWTRHWCEEFSHLSPSFNPFSASLHPSIFPVVCILHLLGVDHAFCSHSKKD